MKSSVDLTENRQFSRLNLNTENEKIVRRVAWRKDTSFWNITKHKPYLDYHTLDLYAYNGYFSSVSSSTSTPTITDQDSSTNYTNVPILAIDMESFTIRTSYVDSFVINDNNLNLQTTRIYLTEMEDYHYDIPEGMTRQEYIIMIAKDRIKSYELDEYEELEDVFEYINFPTGHPKDIKRNRIKRTTIKDKFGVMLKCKFCSGKIKRLPWRNTKVDCVCDKCKQFDVNKKKSIRWGDIHRIDDKTYISGHLYSYMRQAKKRRRPWITKINTLKDKSVKIKGKDNLGSREEPWTLHGRIPQPYDKLFETMDWRERLTGL